jgi:CRP-like cAMP-binding protein
MGFHNLFDDWPDVRSLRGGEVVFAEGDTADVMYFILDGEVELRRHGEAMSVEGEGGVIGETALLDGARHNGTAVARRDTRLARLDRAQLKDLTEDNAAFALHVMARLASHLRAVDAYISARLDANGGTRE